MPRWILALGSLAACAFLMTYVNAVPPQESNPKQPDKANQDAEEAGKRAKVEGNLPITLWAAEPLMANPVAFCFDEKGRAFVAETTRFGNGVPDTRSFMYWVDEDIGSRSVEDRLAMYKKHKYQGYEKFDDHLRMVWDSDGSGRADKSTIFSSGYNQLKDGLAAGVLARKGNVYFTNIPDLYLLRDKDDDGIADEKQSLSTGYGVRCQFVGHDLHGLRMGPDGRLYFSIGDRGLNVTTKEGKKLEVLDEGCVLRCEVDGSNLEVVHQGLRNPQELAFDNFGNLFTYDNNCDSGDRARWVYIVDGGDSGWRCGYQYGTMMHTPAVPQGNRGPWNTEKIWHTQNPDQPAYVIPPLLHFGNGPAGLVHYPGLGLSDKYQNSFFACDFTSNPGNSKIWNVKVKPEGAAFTVEKPTAFVSNMVATDCDFGPDGAFYWSDWTGGWNPPNKGRIYKVTDPTAMQNPAVKEAQTLFAEGFEKRGLEELTKLLSHPHQGIRLEAQYELSARDAKLAQEKFLQVAQQTENRLARFHAIWGLGTLARKDANVVNVIASFAKDEDSEVRLQVVRVLTWMKQVPTFAKDTILALLSDSEKRVQALAATAYGKLAFDEFPQTTTPGSQTAKYAPLFNLLKSNNNADVYTRQAAVNGLFEMTQNPCDLVDALNLSKEFKEFPAVRLGVVLALRRLQCRRLGEFLNDSDPRVVAEAARAIHDQNLLTPMNDLAKLAGKTGLEDAVVFRVLSANFKLGAPDNAQAIAEYAANDNAPDYIRITALKLLQDWANPPKREAITGLRQELPTRPAADAMAAIAPLLQKLFVGSDAVRKEAVACTAKLGIKDVGPLMFEMVQDAKLPASTRVDALNALDALKAKELKPALDKSLQGSEPRLRAAARVVKAKTDTQGAIAELPKLLDDPKASIVEKQMAFTALGQLPNSKVVDETLVKWMNAYLQNQLEPALKLDLLEAAQERSNNNKIKLEAPIREKLKEIDQAARAGVEKDHLSRFRESLIGGDAERGRDIFLNNAAVYCQRCHKLDGQGGDVGPVLNGIAKEKTRDYLLESIVDPNKQIAKGYESVILILLDGRSISGVLRSKEGDEYVLVNAENQVLKIKKDDVDAEKPDKSGMPEDIIKKLSKRELRDVVEFLSRLKEPAK